MVDRTLILALAQLLAAAAWADGALSPDEINRLKQLLRQLRRADVRYEIEIAEQDWAQVDIYLHAPVGAEERARLVRQLKAALRSPADRAMALAALEDLVAADGVVTDAERAMLGEVRAELESTSLGLFARLGRLLAGPVRGAPRAAGHADDLDDFVQNRVYYMLRRQHANLGDFGIPEAELRRLGIAGAILALVARVDQAVDPDEVASLAAALERGWGLAPAHADIVARVAVAPEAENIDYVRLTNAFLGATSEEQRTDFLDALFAVAAADGRISAAEVDEIRRIAHSLKITTHDVNAARDRATQRAAPPDKP